VRFTTTNQKLPERTVISEEITYIKLRIEDDLHTNEKWADQEKTKGTQKL
jgi:hypothetical protein